MNELIKRLKDLGYIVEKTIKDRYTLSNGFWYFNNVGTLTYDKILEAVKSSMVRSAGPSQMIMSEKTYDDMTKVLGLKK